MGNHKMVMAMVRPPLVWFVRRVKPILLVTPLVKIHTPQPDLIQGSDITMAILEVGNHLVEVLVGDIQIMKSHLKTPHLCKGEMHTRMETEITQDLYLLRTEGKQDHVWPTHLPPDIPTTTLRTLHSPLFTQSSPAKSYSRQNSFTYDSNQKINSRTFRKQKSPMRNRSPSLSPSRSAENSDETDLATNDDYATRVASRTAEREREEERRRMQVEMRKREQELLARIKEQQKELDAVKAEKSKVEKQLSRQEREREEERRHMIEKQKNLEQEKQRIEMEEKERRQFEERERRLQEEQERNERQELYCFKQKTAYEVTFWLVE